MRRHETSSPTKYNEKPLKNITSLPKYNYNYKFNSYKVNINKSKNKNWWENPSNKESIWSYNPLFNMFTFSHTNEVPLYNRQDAYLGANRSKLTPGVIKLQRQLYEENCRRYYSQYTTN